MNIRLFTAAACACLIPGAALAATAGSFDAVGVEQITTQASAQYASSLSQSGTGNQATLAQSGAGVVSSTLTQTGSQNVINASQSGSNLSLKGLQQGDNNKAGSDASPLVQTGSNGLIDFAQIGDCNTADFHQSTSGARSTMTLAQTGVSNSAAFIQSGGGGNTIGAVQLGLQNSIGATQQGGGNTISATQLGYHNTLTAAQNGNGDTLNWTQLGATSASVTQNGDGLSLGLTQGPGARALSITQTSLDGGAVGYDVNGKSFTVGAVSVTRAGR